MALMSAEYRDRLEHWIRTLKEDFYTPLGTLEFECFRTMEQLSREEAMSREFEHVEPGFTWGNTYEYAWFRGKVTLPEEAEGKRIVLDLQPGGESTLFVNGHEFGTYRADWVKEAHHYLTDNFLTVSGKAGECYEVCMESYAGHYYAVSPLGHSATGPVLPGSYENPLKEGSRRVLGTSTYGIWDEDAYQLYMDVMTLKGLLAVLDVDSLRAERVAEALEKFTLQVDFEQEKEARSADYRKAREILRPVMEAENGSTMPQFYAIGNAHIDLAWLWPMAETYRKTARTFAAQLRHLKEYPDYKFIQSQPACYEMCRKYYPALFEEIRQAVKEGRWIAEGAMWVEPDTNMAGGEALVRQLLYGKRYYKEMFDVDSRLLWLPDTFGYTAALPQILKGCGVDYLVTQKIFWSYNDGEQFPYHYFTWRGMDGSEVVSFLPTSYTYGTDPEEMNLVWKNRTQKRELDTFLIPFGYGDGGGGPCRDHIEYVERQKNLEGGVKITMENPVDYFDEMEKRGGPVNSYTGELYFTAHRGTYTSQAAIKRLNRKSELALRELEIWSSVASAGGLMEYPAEEVEKLWKETLLNQFHDILPGSSIHRVYEEAERSLGGVVEETEGLMNRVAASLVEAGEGITVFNSLSFARTELVEVPEAFAKGCRTAEGERLEVYAENGKTYAAVTIPAMGAVSIVAADTNGDLAECGISAGTCVPKCCSPAAITATENGYVMENDRIRAVIDLSGEIISYVRKESGREFAARPMNHFRLFKDVPRKYDAWDIDSNYEALEIEGAYDVHTEVVNASGAMAVLKVEGKIGNSSYTQFITLSAYGDRVEFDTTVDWKELHRMLKVSFPTTIYTENGINEVQFGYVERPAHRSRSYDKDRFEVCNHRYSAFCDGGNGFAVLNESKYGIGMKDGALELTLLRAAACPDMRADNRVHHFVYGAMAWNGTFEESSVVRQGYEMNVKPLVMPGRREKFSLVDIEKANIILDTVKAAEDGSGDLILRFYESKKMMTDTAVAFGKKLAVKSAWLCDMLENPQEEISVESGRMGLGFKAFEIKTVRVKLS